MPSPPAGRGSNHYFPVATDALLPRDRRAFWRDAVLDRSEAHFRGPAGFAGNAWGFLCPIGQLRVGRLDPIVLRRSAALCRQDAGDEILLVASIAQQQPGRYTLNGTEIETRPGRIILCDMAKPLTADLGGCYEVNFRLPRLAVTMALGADPGRWCGRMLPANALTALLFQQLRQTAEALPELNDAARAAALDCLTAFALRTLQLEFAAKPTDADAFAWLWDAACRFISGNLGRSALTAADIAQALRCSRTHLYRVFAQHGHTVMGYLQEQRLLTSRTLLTNPHCRLSIAEVAFRCGFEDASAFSRSFRRRFGCQPTEVRREARLTIG